MAKKLSKCDLYARMWRPTLALHARMVRRHVLDSSVQDARSIFLSDCVGVGVAERSLATGSQPRRTHVSVSRFSRVGARALRTRLGRCSGSSHLNCATNRQLHLVSIPYPTSALFRSTVCCACN